MLFGVNFCRRCTRRRRAPGRINTKIWMILFSLLVIIGLLFVAPQWLLVILILMLSAIIIGVILRCGLF